MLEETLSRCEGGSVDKQEWLLPLRSQKDQRAVGGGGATESREVYKTMQQRRGGVPKGEQQRVWVPKDSSNTHTQEGHFSFKKKNHAQGFDNS